MSVQEGLAALTINRSRRRTGRSVFKWFILLLLAAGLLALAAAWPKLSAKFQGVEVSVAPIAYMDAGGELSAAGYVVSDRMSVLAFKGTGRLLKLNVVESQEVRKDEMIAEIDHHELDAAIAQAEAELEESRTDVKRMAAQVAHAETGAVNAKAAVAAAKAPMDTLDSEVREITIKLADAQRRYERDKKLAESQATPFSNVDDRLTEIRLANAQIETAAKRKLEILKHIDVAESQALTAGAQIAMMQSAVAVGQSHAASMAARIDVLKAQLLDAKIYSPFDGVVIEKAAEIGEIVAPISIGGSMARGSIATIAERKSMQAEVDVAEAYISRVKVGQRAQVVVDAFSDKALGGKVLRILPRADRGKATVQVRVAIDHILEHKEVLPDMGLRVKFLPDDAPQGAETKLVKKLAVPRTALLGGAEKPFVWIVTDGTARKTEVVTGETKGDQVEIVSGIKEGQSFVIKGAAALAEDNQKVRIAE